ncbi:hypothetical protein R8Z50_23930 [Longispora sp. K20-0274]|uniref:hypothetical protein n=1 Tax=Longispora sp. K20-0274 TaxID=3088255 RepID=UPI00399AAF9A
MDPSLSAILIAGLGVGGTLLAPLLSQRAARRVAVAAAEAERARRQEEREAAERRTSFEERRTEYTALNALARTARNHLHDSARRFDEAGSLTDEELAAARATWIAYQDRYDAAQMIIPDEMLVLASRMNRTLAVAYKRVKALGHPGGPTSREVVGFCDGQVLDLATTMRQAMRTDLGVAPPKQDTEELH